MDTLNTSENETVKILPMSGQQYLQHKS